MAAAADTAYPSKVLDLDVAQPIPNVRAERPGGEYRSLTLLVRASGVPVGDLTIPFADGRLSASEIEGAIEQRLGAAMAAQRSHATADASPARFPGSISVVIPTRDRPASLERLLDS